jgi:hypothetical protein
MVDLELLNKANSRYYNKNRVWDDDYKEDMDNFILKMYLDCDPAGYGKVFVKKILRDHDSINEHGINIYPVMDKGDMGDVALVYPKRNYFYGEFYDPRILHYSRVLSYGEIPKIFFEVKISYLGKNGTFTVRNIRPYQDFNYYILCFVDCKNNFRPRFLVVDKKVITENHVFTLTPMNGTKEANKDNTDIGYGLSFKRNHWKDLYLESRNLMKGTTYEHLTEYLKEQNQVLKEVFEDRVKLSDNDKNRIKEYEERNKKQLESIE